MVRKSMIPGRSYLNPTKLSFGPHIRYVGICFWGHFSWLNSCVRNQFFDIIQSFSIPAVNRQSYSGPYFVASTKYITTIINHHRNVQVQTCICILWMIYTGGKFHTCSSKLFNSDRHIYEHHLLDLALAGLLLLHVRGILWSGISHSNLFKK